MLRRSVWSVQWGNLSSLRISVKSVEYVQNLKLWGFPCSSAEWESQFEARFCNILKKWLKSQCDQLHYPLFWSNVSQHTSYKLSTIWQTDFQNFLETKKFLYSFKYHIFTVGIFITFGFYESLVFYITEKFSEFLQTMLALLWITWGIQANCCWHIIIK